MILTQEQDWARFTDLAAKQLKRRTKNQKWTKDIVTSWRTKGFLRNWLKAYRKVLYRKTNERRLTLPGYGVFA
jgi:hypothetical protein